MRRRVSHIFPVGGAVRREKMSFYNLRTFLANSKERFFLYKCALYYPFRVCVCECECETFLSLFFKFVFCFVSLFLYKLLCENFFINVQRAQNNSFVYEKKFTS